MAPLEGLTDAHAILLATHICTTGDVTDLPALQAHYPHCFPLERLLRIILTYLPESTEPSAYVPVLQQLTETSSSGLGDRDIDTSAVKDLSEAAARKRVRKVRLRPLKREDEEEEVESAEHTRLILKPLYNPSFWAFSFPFTNSAPPFEHG
jgi:hypothetical protein